MGNCTAIYKIAMPAGTLELLQKFQTDFKPIDSSASCSRWSRDNSLLATGGDDSVVRLYRVNNKKFDDPVILECELRGHEDAIN